MIDMQYNQTKQNPTINVDPTPPHWQKTTRGKFKTDFDRFEFSAFFL